MPRTGEDLQRRDLLTGILLALIFGSSSERYRRLYEAGTIDDSFFPSYAGDEDFGFVTLGGETDEPERMRAQPANSDPAKIAIRSRQISGMTWRKSRCGATNSDACSTFATGSENRRARLPVIRPRKRSSSENPVWTIP